MLAPWGRNRGSRATRLSTRRAGDSAMVPRIIHQFWDRPEPPDDVRVRMDSWPAAHPDWRYIRWNDESAAKLIAEEFGRDAASRFLAAELPAMRADIARIAAIVVHGGMYVEADWGCRRSLEDFLPYYGTLRHGLTRYEVNAKKKPIRLSTGFLASVPRGTLFRNAWRRLQRNIVEMRFSLQISKISGPQMLGDVWYGMLSAKERARYHLITKEDFAKYVRRPGKLEYRNEGKHWRDVILSRRIIDLRKGEAALETFGLQGEAAETPHDVE